MFILQLFHFLRLLTGDLCSAMAGTILATIGSQLEPVCNAVEFSMHLATNLILGCLTTLPLHITTGSGTGLAVSLLLGILALFSRDIAIALPYCCSSWCIITLRTTKKKR
ncbi:hypothetical protein JW905_07480 [bacterium]|nr:hypothetical protein [candidate division CSSED10-310 bacterium]